MLSWQEQAAAVAHLQPMLQAPMELASVISSIAAACDHQSVGPVLPVPQEVAAAVNAAAAAASASSAPSECDGLFHRPTLRDIHRAGGLGSFRAPGLDRGMAQWDWQVRVQELSALKP